jgi:hypothetical protein
MHPDLEHDPSLSKRLQTLPEETQPYGFAEFERRRQERGVRVREVRRLPRLFSSSMAGLVVGTAAAGLVLAVLGLTYWSHAPDLLTDPTEQELTGTPGRAAHGPPPVPEIQADAMEGWLASLPEDPALVRVGARTAVTSLEDRIAQLDDEISAERAASTRPERLQVILQQRSQLLRSLVQVRYAEDLASR